MERSLQATLRQLGRWILMIGGACGVGWGLIATGVFLVVMVWLDLVWEMPPQARIISLVGAVAAGLVLLAIVLRRTWTKTPVGEIARRLDHAGETGGQILAGVELAPGGEAVLRTGTSPLSMGLAEIAVDRATWLASRIGRDQVAPLRPVAKSFAAVGLFVALIGIAVLAMPRLAQTEWNRFADPFGDHPPYSRVQITVEPAGKQVLYGENVDIIARTEGMTVDKVELVLFSPGDENGEALPMFPEPDGSWQATVTNVVNPYTYLVRSHGSRSHRYELGIITVPRIEDVRFRITPPSYTRQGAYEGELPPGGISGLPGTTVEITARSNRPLVGGRIAYIAGSQRQNFPLHRLAQDDKQAAGSFVIERSGRIEIKLLDSDQVESQETFTSPVTQLLDERPFVRLIEPKAISFAVPNAILPVIISAEDDYGVAKVQLFRSLNDSRPLPENVPLPKLPPRQAYETVLLPLAAYGLQVGDEIKLFARVEDNDPGPVDSSGSTRRKSAGTVIPGKGTESTVVVIRIIDQSELDQMQNSSEGLETLLAKYQEGERRLESLMEEVRKLQEELDKLKPGDEKKAAEIQEKMKKLLEQMQRESETLKKLSEQKKPFKVDEQLTQQLAQRAEALKRLEKRMKDAMKDKMSKEELKKMLDDLQKQLKEEQEHLDNEAMKPLRRLEQVLPLIEAEREFEDLVKQQRDLADRLKALKGRDKQDDPALKAQMRELEAEQRQLQEHLRNLLDRIEEKAQALPEGEEGLEGLRKSALDFVKAARGSGADEAMGEGAQGLSEFSGTRGHDGAQKAAESLEKLLGQGQQGMGMEGQGGQSLQFRPGFGPSLGQTARQLMGNGQGGEQGQGEGGGEGSSSRRNAMRNVGLYGQMPPELDKEQKNALGKMDKQKPVPGRTRDPRLKPGDDGAGGYEMTQEGTASGTGDRPVPLRYRRRNSRYFQRLADELRDR